MKISAHKVFIFVMSFFALLMLGALIAIFIFFDPEDSGWSIFFLLYVAVFLSGWSLFSLFGVVYRMKAKQMLFNRVVNTALRQGFFLALILATSLCFQGFRVLYWWTAAPLAALVIFLEFCIQYDLFSRFDSMKKIGKRV